MAQVHKAYLSITVAINLDEPQYKKSYSNEAHCLLTPLLIVPLPSFHAPAMHPSIRTLVPSHPLPNQPAASTLSVHVHGGISPPKFS